MDKARLETLADGVFAIVVTLLVLGIQLPRGTTAANLGSSLAATIPSLATYILSFTIVGLYWIFHHSASRMFKKVDYRVIWLNIILLMFIGLIPFTTSILSEFALSSWAPALYGVNILAINLAGWLSMVYLYHHPTLAESEFTRKMFVAQRNQYAKIASLYAIGVVIAFIAPMVSIYIYGLVTFYLILGTIFPKFTWRKQFNT